MRSVGSVVATLLLSLPVARGLSQEPRRLAQPDSVPFELASALIGAGGLGGDPQILVGSLPGWVTARLKTPSNATVLGSAFLGTTVVGILALSDTPEAVIADMKRALLAQGWKPPQPPPSFGGGFRSATVLSAFDGTPTRITLCGDQQILTATALRHRGTSTMVTVRLAQTAGYPCSPQPPVMPMSGQRAPLPTLYNPSSIINDARGNSPCVQDYGNGTGTMLRTTMSGAALLDHYGKQLQDSGWSRPKMINTTEGRTWTKPDSTGAPLELNLTVLSASRDSTCREINMQIRLPKKP